jgi:hypothetical protein
VNGQILENLQCICQNIAGNIPVDKLGLSPRILKVVVNQYLPKGNRIPTADWLRKQMMNGNVIRWRNFGIKSYNEVALVFGLPTEQTTDDVWDYWKQNVRTEDVAGLI